MSSSVISAIVNNDLCIGCGMCAVICPDHLLEMHFNASGEYIPKENTKKCLKNCGLCMKVCPFADENSIEDIIGKTLFGKIAGICHHPETGYYLTSYVGYAPEMRAHASSGGMVTWLLYFLLKKKVVDYVISVIPNDDPEQLFHYALLSDPESVIGSSGSAYYPVEVSGVLKEILDTSGTCAIVGLPCIIKAVRLAARKNKKLHERIAITIGLVCGQSKSKHFTEYLSALGGVQKPLQKVTFRNKSPQKPASNYFFSCVGSDGSRGQIFWKEGISEAWGNRWFTPNACSYCDDVFAECADVTFMDAWLPEYSKDYKGTNLVLVRSARIEEMLVEGIKSMDVHLNTIPIQRILESQSGVIEEKRVNLGYRLFLDDSAGKPAPKKRIQPGKIPDLFQKKTITLKNQMQCASRIVWSKQHDEHKVENFKKQMQYFLVQISRWNRIAGYCQLPEKCSHIIRGKLQRFFYE